MSGIMEFKSNLEITGSFGMELTGEVVPQAKDLAVGFTKQAFQVTDRRNGKKVWLDFRGAGSGGSVGVSILGNFGFSGSTEDFFSVGSYFYGGKLNVGTVEVDEIVDHMALIYSGSVNVGKGGELTLIFVRPLPVLPFPVAWHSFAAVAGLSLSSSAGAGLIQYLGVFKRPSK